MMRKTYRFIFAATVLFALAAQSSIAFAAPKRGVKADLALETSEFLKRSAYRSLANLNNDHAENGAYGPVNREWDKTRAGRWFIEEQRYGRDVIIGGIAHQDKATIERGLQIFRWGFAQQKADGSFEDPDPFHSTSFFVEGTAHALLLLEKSRFGKDYKTVINEMKPKVLAAARSMLVPAVEKTGRERNLRFGHRQYLVASAFGLAGVLNKDKQLIEKSHEYMRLGMTQQHPSGYNPEKDGYDSSYHAVGTVYMNRLLTMVAGDELHPKLFEATRKAIEWQASRVNPDGTLNTTGNTRVGGVNTETDRAKRPKKPTFLSHFRSFAYWAQLSGDEKFLRLAERVADKAGMLKKSDDARKNATAKSERNRR